LRDAYLGHPSCDDTAEFVDLYDSESFDPSYDPSLEELEPCCVGCSTRVSDRR
jgi:hypothetical protein